MDEKPDGRGERLSARIPTVAVMVVVLTAVATAVMVAPTLSESQDERPVAERLGAAVPASAAAMVHAPPLDDPALAHRPGALPACRDCGVVESVVALAPRARDDGLAYQMRIRMDDGSLRTVEQRGALAAGSRVMVAGRSVRSVSTRPGPG